MNSKKAFWYSFLLSMAVVLAAFGAVYGALTSYSRETDTPQTGVPINMPGVEDSKTILLCVDEEFPYFFLFKFNAIENRVGTAVISPSYKFSSGKTLADSLQKAGAMQCLMDTETEFGIKVDYYIQCSWTQLGHMANGMNDFGVELLGDSLPPVIRDYLLKSAERIDGKSIVNAARKASAFLDTELGLAFLARSRHSLMENNMEKLSETAGNAIKENYDGIVTNINTQRLKRLDRIVSFLCGGHRQHNSAVITRDDNQRQQKIDSIIQ